MDVLALYSQNCNICYWCLPQPSYDHKTNLNQKINRPHTLGVVVVYRAFSATSTTRKTLNLVGFCVMLIFMVCSSSVLY